MDRSHRDAGKYNFRLPKHVVVYGTPSGDAWQFTQFGIVTLMLENLGAVSPIIVRDLHGKERRKVDCTSPAMTSRR